MALRGPTDLVHSLAGYDLSGLGALTEISESSESVVADVTPLGPLGAIQHEAPVGTLMYSLSESGHLRDNQASLRRLFGSGLVATPWPSIVGHEGGAIGARCRLVTDLRVKVRNMVPATSDISKVDVEYLLHQDGELYEEARLLASFGLNDGQGPGATPATDFRLDGGAESDLGGVLCLMFDPDASRWRGYPTLTLQVRHSDTGTSWTALGAAWAVDRDDAPHTVIEIAAATAINRYVALDWTYSGTRDAFALMGDHTMGDTEISVDGGSGTERIQSGDTLDIDGNDYTVESATDDGGGAWTVTLTSGLVADESDNEVVTQDGSDMELRLAACLHRTA